jgi:hypothetical protein
MLMQNCIQIYVNPKIWISGVKSLFLITVSGHYHSKVRRSALASPIGPGLAIVKQMFLYVVGPKIGSLPPDSDKKRDLTPDILSFL